MTGKLKTTDIVSIESLLIGDFTLMSKVKQNSSGIVERSCSGYLTANVFFGESGVGKSTIANLVLGSKQRLYETGTSSHETTTLGTWLSSGITVSEYAKSIDEYFGNEREFKEFYNSSRNLVFMDTEGLSYQTEYGKNYDVVTLLPHTLIAKNVFLVLTEKLLPGKVNLLISKLTMAARRTKGGFKHRNGKLFGKLIIVVNKAQISTVSKTKILSDFIKRHQTVYKLIRKTFVDDLEIVLLPRLEWPTNKTPNRASQDFYLGIGQINSALPTSGEPMKKGLLEMVKIILESTRSQQKDSTTCENFENLLEELYTVTTEDEIDIDEVDYNLILTREKLKLEKKLLSFDPFSSMRNDFIASVCKEADSTLINCMFESLDDEVTSYENRIRLVITEVEMGIGSQDRLKSSLTMFFENELKPEYILAPLTSIKNRCRNVTSPHDNQTVYSQAFIEELGASKFKDVCLHFITGKTIWHDWEECSKSCRNNDKCGYRIRLAEKCVPSYAVCRNALIQREDCNCDPCPQVLPDVPVGSLLPWIPKPNQGVHAVVAETYKGWIKCDGRSVCSEGTFKNKYCTNMAGRGIIGEDVSYKASYKFDSRFPKHEHNRG